MCLCVSLIICIFSYLVSTHVVGCDVEVVGTWGTVGTWDRTLMRLLFTIVRSSISVASSMSTKEHDVTATTQIPTSYICVVLNHRDTYPMCDTVSVSNTSALCVVVQLQLLSVFIPSPSPLQLSIGVVYALQL